MYLTIMKIVCEKINKKLHIKFFTSLVLIIPENINFTEESIYFISLATIRFSHPPGYGFPSTAAILVPKYSGEDVGFAVGTLEHLFDIFGDVKLDDIHKSKYTCFNLSPFTAALLPKSRIDDVSIADLC